LGPFFLGSLPLPWALFDQPVLLGESGVIFAARWGVASDRPALPGPEGFRPLSLAVEAFFSPLLPAPAPVSSFGLAFLLPG